MPMQHCTCGARYTFAASSVGKKAKCKKCGRVFDLEPEDEEIIPLADGIGVGGEPATARQRPDAAARTGPEGTPLPFQPPPVVIEKPEARPKGYARDLLATYVFVSRPHNLVVFCSYWFLLFLAVAVLPYGLIFGTVGIWIIYGWYYAFLFAVIEGAVAGEDELPVLSLMEGAYENIVLPMLKWAGTWLVVMLPAGIALVVWIVQNPAGWPVTPRGGPLSLAAGVGGMVPMAVGTTGYVCLALALAGLFCWPMVVLCVAVGGFASFARLDLVIETMIKTLPVYVLTVLLVYISDAFAYCLPADEFTVLGKVVTTGIALYLKIVAMRVIGLYYYHFKRRFAWSWD